MLILPKINIKKYFLIKHSINLVNLDTFKIKLRFIEQLIIFSLIRFVILSLTEKLIDWDKVPRDPVFVLNFPQKEMLGFFHFEKMAAVLRRNSNNQEIQDTSNKISMELNPHPAGQI